MNASNDETVAPAGGGIAAAREELRHAVDTTLSSGGTAKLAAPPNCRRFVWCSQNIQLIHGLLYSCEHLNLQKSCRKK